MNQFKVIFFTVTIAAALAGCGSGKYPDVAGNIRQSLKTNGLSEVSVSQNREKGVVTLTGNVPTADDKTRAESFAKNEAGNEVIADQIEVVPANNKTANTVNTQVDKGIEHNLKAAFTQNRVDKHVNYSVKNEVVTLTGNVRTPAQRREAQKVAKAVPNVQQVVDEVNVRNEPATSSH